MPQQLHLAIPAQFVYPVRTCRGMKQQLTSDQTAEQTTYTLIPFITHITNVLE